MSCRDSCKDKQFVLICLTASEAAYDQYYKLKKKYDNEFLAKSEALTRVDEVSE